jgi:hypothetical protein
VVHPVGRCQVGEPALHASEFSQDVVVDVDLEAEDLALLDVRLQVEVVVAAFALLEAG